MSKLLHLLAALTVALLLCHGMIAAAPETPVAREGSLSLISRGQIPDAAPPVQRGFATLRLFRTGADLAGAAQAIRTGLFAVEESIPLRSYALTVDQLRDLLQDLINDTPALFHVESSYRYYTVGDIVDSLVPRYNCSPEAYALRLDEYEARLDSLLSLHDKDMSQIETVLFYHDLLSLSFSYDRTEPLNYDVYSFLTEGQGVCQAYTLTMAAILRELGMEVSYSRSIAMNHIWNLVRAEGEWYHVDATRDDPIPDRPGLVSHSVLLLSDEGLAAEGYYDVSNKSDIRCTSTRFDHADWRSVCSPMVRSEGVWYGVCRSNGALSAYDPKDGRAQTPLYTVTDRWVSGEGQSYPDCFSGLAAANGFLFLNTPRTVLAIDPVDRTVTELAFSPASGAIFGLWGDKDGLHVALGTAPGASDRIEILPIPALSRPDYTLPFHLYDENGLIGSYASFPAIAAAMRRPTASYTVAVHTASAAPLALGVSALPRAKQLTIRPLLKDREITLSMGSGLGLRCPLVLERVSLLAEKPNLLLALGSHNLTLIGRVSLGSSSMPLSVMGSTSSVLTLQAETAPITLTGRVSLGRVDLDGMLNLGGWLNADVLRVQSSSEILLSYTTSSLSLERVTGGNELALRPSGVSSPSIEISEGVDALIRYHYLSVLGDRALLTAPQLASEDLAVLCTLGGREVDVTELFDSDKDGSLFRSALRMLTVENGTLKEYLSLVENEHLTLPESITAIAPYAFGRAAGLSSVLIGDAVQSLAPYSIGYLVEGDKPIPHPSLTLRTPVDSAAARYAAGNGIKTESFVIEENEDFVYRYYAAEKRAELIAWRGSASTLVIPNTLTAEDGSVCTTVVDADLTEGQRGLSIFAPFPQGSRRNPYAAEWATRHSYYPQESWHMLTLMRGQTTLRIIPLPAETAVREVLILPSPPTVAGVTFRFLGWDGDGDGEVDPIPERLDRDTTLHAVFEALDGRVLISWYDENGSLYHQTAPAIGEVILPPEPPSRPDTVAYRYRFLGWSGFEEGMTATNSRSFSARFERIEIQYTYRFLDDQGRELLAVSAPYGSPIRLPAQPTKPSDERYSYTFSHFEGYAKNMTLTGDMTFVAVFIATELSSPHPADITSAVYPIEHGILSRVEAGTTVEALLSRLDQAPYLAVRTEAGEAVSGDKRLRTGMQVVLLAKDGVQVIRSVTVAVTGDLSGDGARTITDFVRLKSHLLQIASLLGVEAEAADLNGDGEVTLTDFIRMKRVLLEG